MQSVGLQVCLCTKLQAAELNQQCLHPPARHTFLLFCKQSLKSIKWIPTFFPKLSFFAHLIHFFPPVKVTLALGLNLSAYSQKKMDVITGIILQYTYFYLDM